MLAIGEPLDLDRKAWVFGDNMRECNLLCTAHVVTVETTPRHQLCCQLLWCC